MCRQVVANRKMSQRREVVSLFSFYLFVFLCRRCSGQGSDVFFWGGGKLVVISFQEPLGLGGCWDYGGG